MDDRIPRRSVIAGLAAAIAGAGGVALFARRDDGALVVDDVPDAAAPAPSATVSPSAEPTAAAPAADAAPEPVETAAAEPPDEPVAGEEPTDVPPEEHDAAGEPVEAEVGAVLLLCRDAWGAAPATTAYRPHELRQLTLHHTAAALGENRRAPARLRGHQRYHQEQGWPDLAYHYAVDRDGNAYEGRPVDAAGDTFTDYDPAGHFLVVCEGDFRSEQPTPAMLETVAGLFAWGCERFGIDPATLAGHRDHASTSCPGDNLYAVLADGSLRARVEERLAVGVELDVACGDDGRTRVAAIESA